MALKAKAPKSFPKFIEPMKARLVDGPQPGTWIYEIKFDGFRAIAFKVGTDVKLFSRNEKDLGEKFPEVVKAISRLKAESAIIDGEIVAMDPDGKSSFQALQAYDLRQEKPPLFFYTFDLLRLDGVDLQKEPLQKRKKLLQKTIPRKDKVLHFSRSLVGEVSVLMKEAKKLDLEGLIGKRADSVYEAGERTGSWIKLKLHHEQELVVGGYTNPEGAREDFGALLLGYYEKKKFHFAGKVGTGFNASLLKTLYAKMKKIAQDDCPFVDLPEKRAGRYGAGVTASVMQRCHWVKPSLVCQVKFTEWTRDGKLRHPVFLGLREDKSAKDVVREMPA